MFFYYEVYEVEFWIIAKLSGNYESKQKNVELNFRIELSAGNFEIRIFVKSWRFHFVLVRSTILIDDRLQLQQLRRHNLESVFKKRSNFEDISIFSKKEDLTKEEKNIVLKFLF